MSTLSDRSPLARLAHILHAASVVGSGAWGDADANPPRNRASETEMSRDLVDLFSILRDRNVPYLLVGGVALLRYIDGRNTDDLDLILAVESLKQVPEIVVENQNPDAARGRFRSLRVDLLFTSNPVFRLVHDRHATMHRFFEVDVRCATVDGLALLKLYALPFLYQQNELQRAALYETDLAMLCLRHQPALDALVDTLGAHLNDGQVSELRGIIAEISARVQRMRGDSESD